jgi:hypothetical protein
MPAKRMVPFILANDDHVPVDISFVFESEKPAGQHGFLGVKGDRMVFEDGTEGRFWGTCFNSGACFPEHAYSEMVARRLAKFGVNMVRFHQMDAEWATPNLFSFNRADPLADTRHLDPRSMERLDYLIHCLKAEGIYIYLDLLTYRQFRPGDGVDAVDELPQAAKPYCCFDPRLIELQKEFSQNIWTHVNQYTGLAYKDDPAIVLTEVVNEADLFSSAATLEPYRSRLEGQYREWAAAQGVAITSGTVDFSKRDSTMAQFFVQVMQGYYREMTEHMRSIGVRVPIAGTNWSISLGVTAAQSGTDFTDSHCYWNFPTWESDKGTAARPMVGSMENSFQYLSMMRLAGKPFFVSEWDNAWPDPYRAESPLSHAAVAALQGWSGMTIHTYRYSTWEPQDCIGGGASTINGIPYRNHFDSFNDPAKFGLFYHAALLFRRGDARRALKSVAVDARDESGATLLKRAHEVPALRGLVERHRVGMLLPGVEAGDTECIAYDKQVIAEDAGEVASDTGELWRSWKKRYGWIDTPRTKVAYGFLGKAGVIKLKGLQLKVTTDFATIALSSLTDDVIAESDSLLLSAVGRCDNSGVKFDKTGKHQLSYGHAPVLIAPIEASIKLMTSRPNLKVWVISDKGEAVVKLKTVHKDGVLSFDIGPQPWRNPSTMYYLLRV